MIFVDGRFDSHCETKEAIPSKGVTRFVQHWIEAILNRDQQMPQRDPRQHRSVVVGLRAQQEDGTIGWPPLRKGREKELFFLYPVDLDPISASGFKFRLMDIHHGDIPARPCQSTTEHDPNSPGTDDVDTLHPYEYLVAPTLQAVLQNAMPKKSGGRVSV